MKTVVGLFDSMDHAKKAALDLENAGIPHNDISIVANNEGGKYAPVATDTTTTSADADRGGAIGRDALVGAEIGGVAGLIIALTGFAVPGLGWIAGAGWLWALIIGAGAGAAIGGLVGALTDVGVPEEDAANYQEGVRRGGTLLAVKAQDAMAHRVAEIMGDDGAVNIDERAEQYRQEGFVPQRTAQAPPPAPPVPAQPKPAYNTANTQGEAVLPVAKEELEVGKREVQKGGVRVYTHVTQQPVQEQVSLREEHVDIERRPVDRPAGPGEMGAFKEGAIEVRETAEMPVVTKQARVVEEVVVGKEVTDRTQTVQDTVRQTEVEVEKLPGDHTSRTRSFENYAGDFRRDFQTNYGNLGSSYEQYEPAYQYGYEAVNNPTYRGRDWNAIEPDLRRDWETRRPNTWDRFKNSIRFAWDKGTGAERGGIQTGGRDADGTQDTRGISEKVADAVTGDRIDDKTGRPV